MRYIIHLLRCYWRSVRRPVSEEQKAFGREW